VRWKGRFRNKAISAWPSCLKPMPSQRSQNMTMQIKNHWTRSMDVFVSGVNGPEILIFPSGHQQPIQGCRTLTAGTRLWPFQL
jgi:hypothetical protein